MLPFLLLLALSKSCKLPLNCVIRTFLCHRNYKHILKWQLVRRRCSGNWILQELHKSYIVVVWRIHHLIPKPPLVLRSTASCRGLEPGPTSNWCRQQKQCSQLSALTQKNINTLVCTVAEKYWFITLKTRIVWEKNCSMV